MGLMPEVTGVVETCLYVDDLERAVRFYEDVCEFKRLIGDERFCALSVADRNVLLLFRRGRHICESIPTPGGIIPPHDGSGKSARGVCHSGGCGSSLETAAGRSRYRHRKHRGLASRRAQPVLSRSRPASVGADHPWLLVVP